MEKTKLMPGRIMVLLVTLGTFLGAVGLYEPFAEFAGAGATVPLLGGDENIKKLIDTAKALEGLPRHASSHAAGVVITHNKSAGGRHACRLHVRLADPSRRSQKL